MRGRKGDTGRTGDPGRTGDTGDTGESTKGDPGEKGQRGIAGLGISAKAVIIAYAIQFLALVGAVAYIEYRSSETDGDIIDAQIASCETGRAGLGVLIQSDIDNLKQTSPKLFPDIPIDVFNELKAERLETFAELKASLAPELCEMIYRDLP